MAEMFGLIAAGRMVQTNFVPASDTEVIAEVTEADSLNHIVIFLTGMRSFPSGTGGAVYIRWPSQGYAGCWHFLGFISNEKPSAIFKVAQLSKASSTSSQNGLFSSNRSAVAHGSVQVGVSVEDLSTLRSRTSVAGTSTTQQATLSEFADKMAKSVVHHAESYATSVPRADGGQVEVVPLAAIHEWLGTFSRRFQQNPFFWRSLSD